MEDDYLNYFDDFEQDYDDSKHSSNKQSAKPEINSFEKTGKHPKKTKKSTLLGSSPKDRLLSSKEHELRDVQNKLSATTRHLKEIEKENKTLRRLQVRQEKELNKLSSQEGELPTILERHNREVRSLKDQLKKSQRSNKDLTKKLSDQRDELWRVNEQKKELESLSKRRDLKEREHLMMELQEAMETLRKREHKIQELEKGIELMGKTHSQEVKSLLMKHRLKSNQLINTEQDMLRFRQQLKEKERLLEVTNIYTQRVPYSSVPPPLPAMADKSSQTILTQPSSDCHKAMVLTLKHTTTTGECQTEGNWRLDMFPPKRDSKLTNKMSFSDEDTFGSVTQLEQAVQPHPPAIPRPNPPSITSSLAKSVTKPLAVPVTTASASTGLVQDSIVPPVIQPVATAIQSPPKQPHPPQSQPHLPQSSVLKSSPPKEDEPLMDLRATPIAGPMITPTPPSVPPAMPSATPTSMKPHQPFDKKDNIHSILFGKQTEPAPPQAVGGIQNKQEPKATPNSNQPGDNALNKKQKDDLMKKLFPQKYAGSSDPPIRNDDEDAPGQRDDNFDNEPQRRKRGDNPVHTRTNDLFGSDNLTDNQPSVRQRDKINSNSFSQLIESTGTTSAGPLLQESNQATTNTSNNNSNLLTQLFNTTNTNTQITNNTNTTTTNNGAEGISTSSIPSQSERVRNMHRGLPSMASEDDPYGSGRQRRLTSGSITGTTTGITSTKTGATAGITGSNGSKETGAKHGRRAGPPTNVKSSNSGTGLIFGERNVTTTTTQHQTPTTIFGNGTTSPDQNRIAGGGGAYSWETRVNIHSNGTARSNHTTSNNNTRLSFDDELDEITIT